MIDDSDSTRAVVMRREMCNPFCGITLKLRGTGTSLDIQQVCLSNNFLCRPKDAVPVKFRNPARKPTIMSPGSYPA